MGLDFLKEAANVVLVGPNGVGKSTIAANIAHRAVLDGHTVRFATAASMLGELAAIDSDTLLQRKLRFYARQQLLVIDEVGYLSYSNRHADLLFSIVSSRTQQNSTIITTNRPFAEWGEAFPNAALRRGPGRPPRPQRRDHRHRRRFIPPQGGRGAPEAAQRRAPPPAAGERAPAIRQGRPAGHRGRLRRRSRAPATPMEAAAAGGGAARLSPRRRRPRPRLPPRPRRRRSLEASWIGRHHQPLHVLRPSARRGRRRGRRPGGPCPTLHRARRPGLPRETAGPFPAPPRSAPAHGCRIRRSGTGPQWNATSSTSAVSRPCSSPCAATSAWSTPTATPMPCSSVETPQGSRPAPRSSPSAVSAERLPAPAKLPHPRSPAGASGYRGSSTGRTPCSSQRTPSTPCPPSPSSSCPPNSGNVPWSPSPPSLQASPRGSRTGTPAASSVPTTLPLAAMTPPNGCSEGTAGSSACGPPSTVTTGTTCAGVTLEGNMLDTDDRLID